MFTEYGFFTTVVNMAEIVNILTRINRDIQDAGVTLRLEDDHIRITQPAGVSCLQIVNLYRPSSEDVRREASPEVILVLAAATRSAVQAAAQHNYIQLTGTGYRIVAPGIALIQEPTSNQAELHRQVRLMGRTGVVAETLLLGGRREWSIRDLASDAGVAPALAHRVASSVRAF